MEPSDKKQHEIRDILNKIVEGRINANRRYIDEILEKIQDQNRRYYLEKIVAEVTQMEAEAKAGNLQRAYQHRVMIDTYKGILEKAFGLTE